MKETLALFFFDQSVAKFHEKNQLENRTKSEHKRYATSINIFGT